MVLHYLIRWNCIDSMFIKFVFNCIIILILFYQVKDSIIYAQPGPICQTRVKVRSIFPDKIVSKGDRVNIQFENNDSLRYNINRVIFAPENSQWLVNPNQIPCINIVRSVINYNSFTCSTNSTAFNPNVNRLVLTAYGVCNNLMYPISFSTFYNGSIDLIDPIVISIHPSHIFLHHKSNFIIEFSRIELSTMNKIKIQNIFDLYYTCGELTRDIKSFVFHCTLFQLSINEIKIEVTLNNFILATHIIKVFPRPAFVHAAGFTFAGAKNPVEFYGNNFLSLYEPKISLYKNLQLPSNCSVWSTSVVYCGSALVFENTRFPIELKVNFFSHGNLYEEYISVYLRQNPKPSIKFAVYSFKTAKLTINLVDYHLYYANITHIEIFDASKNLIIPCSYKLTIQNSSISCVSETQVMLQIWTDYIILKIGSWEIQFYCIETVDPGVNVISFIITVLSFVLVVGFACVLVCRYSSKSMRAMKSGMHDGFWPSHTSAFESTESDMLSAKKVRKVRRNNRPSSKRRSGKYISQDVSSIPSTRSKLPSKTLSIQSVNKSIQISKE